MSDDHTSSELERRTKRVFDDSVAALDAATRSRLTQARYRALEDADAEVARGRRTRAWLIPAGALAATALVAAVFVWQRPPTSDSVQSAALDDLEILLGEEDLVEMLDEELEFYGWLEAQPEFADADDSVG